MDVHERHELYQLLTVTGNAHRARLSQWFERGGWMTADVDGSPVNGSPIRWESMLGARSTIAGSSDGPNARQRARESGEYWTAIYRGYSEHRAESPIAPDCHSARWYEASDGFAERELIAGRAVPGALPGDARSIPALSFATREYGREMAV